MADVNKFELFCQSIARWLQRIMKMANSITYETRMIFARFGMIDCIPNATNRQYPKDGTYKTRSAITKPTEMRCDDGVNGTMRNAMAMRMCLRMWK